MAAAIGCVQGAIQAMSRSYYSRLIPADRASEFFGFYNMMGKFAAVLGPFLMAATAALTGNSRTAILSVAMLFVGGAVMLAFATRSTRAAPARRTGTRLAARTLPLLSASGGRDAEPDAEAPEAIRARSPQGPGRHADLRGRLSRALPRALLRSRVRASERRDREGDRHRMARLSANLTRARARARRAKASPIRRCSFRCSGSRPAMRSQRRSASTTIPKRNRACC